MPKIITVTEETITLPNGIEVEYQFVHHPGGAAVIAVNDKNEVALLRQYRPVAEGWLWEIPAGKRDHGEEPFITAERELREEAGVIASSWQELGAVYSSPGIFTEVIHLYLATGLTDVGCTPDEDELFELHWLPLEEAVAMARDGRINDAKSIIALLRCEGLVNIQAAPSSPEAATD
jgi:8-oxo-dGTP pyrophosphatase MutT (NUDIX family)